MSNPHIGSSFDDFLAEEAILEEATAVAVKRVIAWQIEQEMAPRKLTKTAMAAPLEPPISHRYQVRSIALLLQPSIGADRPR